MRIGLVLVGLLSACGGVPVFPKAPESSTAQAQDSSGTTATTGDSGEPCDCDDGVYCNGEETCDAEGACLAGEAPSPPDEDDPCFDYGACDEDTDSFAVIEIADDPRCTPLPATPSLDPADHAYWYWPVNKHVAPDQMTVSHYLTGHYGLVFDERTGDILHLGALTDGLDAQNALQRDNLELEGLPSADLRFEAGSAGSGLVADSFEGVHSTSRDRTRMINGGRFMNRLFVPRVAYSADPAINGQVVVASMPRHVVLTQVLPGTDSASQTARIVLGGAFIEGHDTEVWLEDGRAVALTTSDGTGWLFVADGPDGDVVLVRTDAGEVVATQSGGGTGSEVSLLVAPLSALTDAEAAMYVDPSLVRVTHTTLDAEGAEAMAQTPGVWDRQLGAYRLDLHALQETGAPGRPDWEDPHFHNWYGRHTLSLDPGTLGTVSVPIALHGTNNLSWYITGGAFLLRDQDGLPVGLPLQISKNWHNEYWYHLYSQPTVSAPVELELTVASSKWGTAYAASHAQLSLVGWSDAGGHWQESALGAFGESVTYDPDLTLNRAMVDDVRPVLVQAASKWNWTGNVGGADFLRYVSSESPSAVTRLGRVRTHYNANGPNLTDVVFAGVTGDGRIQAEVRSQLAATDDLVRVWYHFTYTFLEDTPYERLAFFQVAADQYSDNLFSQIAWGDETGESLRRALIDHGRTGYAGDADRGIALTGSAPWVLLFDNARNWDSLPEHLADVGFIVREFEADIGGTLLTTPHINIHRTNNGASQFAFELGLPHEEGSPWCGAPCGGETRFVPAGSEVRATVEYVVIPNDPATYYGESDHLLEQPVAVWGTPQMMVHLAADNQLTVTPSLGTVVRTHPVELEAEPGSVAAEFSLAGGLGRTPITVHGLVRHDGWQLWVSDGTDWEPVAGEVHGNDHWQANLDSARGTWSLTWNVENRGTNDYRLTWAP